MAEMKCENWRKNEMVLAVQSWLWDRWNWESWTHGLIAHSVRAWIQIPLHYTRKHAFLLSNCSEKMVFPNKLHWNTIFLVLSWKITFIFPNIMTLFYRREINRRVTRGVEWGRRSPLHFLKIEKKCPNFREKCLDCGHLCVKFLI